MASRSGWPDPVKLARMSPVGVSEELVPVLVGRLELARAGRGRAAVEQQLGHAGRRGEDQVRETVAVDVADRQLGRGHAQRLRGRGEALPDTGRRVRPEIDRQEARAGARGDDQIRQAVPGDVGEDERGDRSRGADRGRGRESRPHRTQHQGADRFGCRAGAEGHAGERCRGRSRVGDRLAADGDGARGQKAGRRGDGHARGRRGQGGGQTRARLGLVEVELGRRSAAADHEVGKVVPVDVGDRDRRAA